LGCCCVSSGEVRAKVAAQAARVVAKTIGSGVSWWCWIRYRGDGTVIVS
jgi:hypothetical protein